MTTFNWGILATGNIAHAMAHAIQFVEDGTLLAVGSRSQENADRFGDQWEIPRRYSSYEALAADPDIDIIYIATPQSHHYDNMKLCLEAGKHVLCEKPLTLNALEAAECLGLAQDKGLFLMEALWMRFFPVIEEVIGRVLRGDIGKVELVTADFHITRTPPHRLYDPHLGGGALLDLGIYPLSFATMLLGYPQTIHSTAQIGETGVDELNTMQFGYANGATALLSSGIRLEKELPAYILGSEGTIKVHETFFMPEAYSIKRHGQETAEVVTNPPQGSGYVHEVMEVHECLRAGKLESDIMPHSTTLKTMQLMDRLRVEWGLVYPREAA